MTGRIFYIDPLNGSASNDGTTSGTPGGGVGPFSSLADVLWDGDADPATYGGTGDVYYLIASTGDVISADATKGNYHNYSFEADVTRWGHNVYNNYFHITPNGGPATFIGVNTNLEEDGTRYEILWDPYDPADTDVTNNNREFFDQNGVGECFRNITWNNIAQEYAGKFYAFTSGGDGFYFINCKWDWSGPFNNHGNYPLFASVNPSNSFKHCEFIGPGKDVSTPRDCIQKMGAQYGQHNYVIGCVFTGWKDAYQHASSPDSFYGNLIYSCDRGFVFPDQGTGKSTGLYIANNLFYNIDGDAIHIGNATNKFSPVIINNLFVDIGAYAVNSDSSYEPQYPLSFAIRKNVFQNCTSGTIGPNVLACDGGIHNGFTGDGSLGGISENVSITGLTLEIDSTTHGVTLQYFPTSALGITGTFGIGAISSGAGFLNSGTSGAAGGTETEQARVTS